MNTLCLGKPFRVDNCLYRVSCILNDDESNILSINPTTFEVLYNNFTIIEVAVTTTASSFNVRSNSDWIKINKLEDKIHILCYPTSYPKIGQVYVSAPGSNVVVLEIIQVEEIPTEYPWTMINGLKWSNRYINESEDNPVPWMFVSEMEEYLLNHPEQRFPTNLELIALSDYYISSSPENPWNTPYASSYMDDGRYIWFKANGYYNTITNAIVNEQTLAYLPITPIDTIYTVFQQSWGANTWKLSTAGVGSGLLNYKFLGRTIYI